MDLFDLKILSLNLNIGVDAIGPETYFTIEKDWKSGHQVVTRWSPSGHRVVTKWSPSITKNMVLNSSSILKHVLVVSDDTGTLEQKT